jgi:polyamine oxidase
MMSRIFGTSGKQHTVELGANWVQGETFSRVIFVHKAISEPAIGTQVGNGPKNPILTLAEKHKVKTIFVRIIAFVTLNSTHQPAV